MKQWIKFILILSAISHLTGCVAHDARVNEEIAKKIEAEEFTASFHNKPIYVSHNGGLVGHDHFEPYVESYKNKADRIILTVNKNVGLTIQLEKAGEATLVKSYRFDKGLVETKEGRYILPRLSGYAGGGGVIGYQSKSVTLFLNNDGNLVAVQSGGGAGLFGPFPIGQYAKLMSIFPRTNK